MCGRNFIYFTGFTLIVFMVVPVTEEREERGEDSDGDTR